MTRKPPREATTPSIASRVAQSKGFALRDPVEQIGYPIVYLTVNFPELLIVNVPLAAAP